MRLPPLVLVAAGGVALLASGCGTKTIDSDSLEQQLAKLLAPQAGEDPKDVSVDCPDDQEVKKGHKFDCEITTTDGSKVRVVVTLTNDDGHFSATVPRESGA
jgi:hypothetical protein